MRVNGAWIKRYYMLCSKTHSTLGNLLYPTPQPTTHPPPHPTNQPPHSLQQAGRSTNILWDLLFIAVSKFYPLYYFFFKLNKFPCHTGYIIILPFTLLTHWGCVMHICIGYLTIIGSEYGLLPGRRQAIIWTNAGILLTVPLGTNLSEILIKVDTFSFKKIDLKMSSGKWQFVSASMC